MKSITTTAGLFRLLLIYLFLFTGSHLLKAQCYATSTVNGSTAFNDNTIGTLGFSNVNNAIISDNTSATATAIVSLFTGSSNYLKVTGFGFNVPSYSSICGVVVEIEKKATGIVVFAWIRDNEVKLVKANSITGNNLGYTGTDWSGTDTYVTHGASNNLWGTTLTPADVNASDFGVAISAKFNGLLGVFPSAQIDNIRMTVYYNPVLPVHLVSFDAALKNNHVLLNWKTADEEVNDLIVLQRLEMGATNWKDIARYEIKTNNTGNEYNYTDPLIENGNYSYRLKTINNVSLIQYSTVKKITFAGKTILSVYPNPSSSYITISHSENIKSIQLHNLYWQEVKANIQRTGNSSAKVDISALPNGMYYATVDNHRVKFIKE